MSWANTRYGLNLKDRDLKQFLIGERAAPELDRNGLQEFLVEKASATLSAVDLMPAMEFLLPDWGRRALADWLHHKFGIAIDPADWGDQSKAEVVASVRKLSSVLYAQKEAEFPVRVGMTRYLHERTQTQPARYDREGLAAWASDRFHTLIDREELNLKLRPEIEQTLLEIASQHYAGATLAEELEARIEASFGPVPNGPKFVAPTPDANALASLAAWARQTSALRPTATSLTPRAAPPRDSSS